MIKPTMQDRVLQTVLYGVLSIALIVVIYPLFFVIIASISDPVRVNTGEVWIVPLGLTLDGYREIFTDDQILRGYWNSVLYTVFGTLLNLVLTISSAYALSRRDMVGRNLIMGVLVFTMFFTGGLIPLFLLVRSLGLYDTFFIMILVMPNAVSVFNIIIARTFFQSNIPQELLEAASMDGCSDFRFLTSVVIPISGAIIAVLMVFYAVSHWNAFFGALVFLKSESRYPLQLLLRGILLSHQLADDMWVDDSDALKHQMLAESIKYGVIVVASIPVLVLYPFVQKHYVRGVMIGAIKG
jgi:putative aldouronate transport system permease protein